MTFVPPFFSPLYLVHFAEQGRGVQQASNLRRFVPVQCSVHGCGHCSQPVQIHRRTALLLPGERRECFGIEREDREKRAWQMKLNLVAVCDRWDTVNDLLELLSAAVRGLRELFALQAVKGIYLTWLFSFFQCFRLGKRPRVFVNVQFFFFFCFMSRHRSSYPCDRWIE